MLLALLTFVALGPGPAAVLRDYVATKLEMDIGAPSNGQPFDAVMSEDPPLVRIGVVGDVGTGDAEEYETATAMDALPGPNLDALVLLGDKVYPSGDPERLDATLFEPFGPVLGKGTDLIAALGNHDVEEVDAALRRHRHLVQPARATGRRAGWTRLRPRPDPPAPERPAENLPHPHPVEARRVIPG